MGVSISSSVGIGGAVSGGVGFSGGISGGIRTSGGIGGTSGSIGGSLSLRGGISGRLSGSLGPLSGSLTGGLSLASPFSDHGALSSIQGGAVSIRRMIYGVGISTIIPDCVIEETHRDDLEITEHPVEQGSSIASTIADHAYKKPREVTLRWSWSDSSGHNDGFVINIYGQLRDIQNARVPFSIYTGKCAYKTMLIASLGVTTNTTAEFVVNAVMVCREVILVSTSTVTQADAAAQSDPSKTSPVMNKGAIQPQKVTTPQQDTNLPAGGGGPDYGTSKPSYSDPLSTGGQGLLNQTVSLA